jgi:hypothetical protein
MDVNEIRANLVKRIMDNGDKILVLDGRQKLDEFNRMAVAAVFEEAPTSALIGTLEHSAMRVEQARARNA